MAARPRGAESALARRPQALAFPPAHLSSRCRDKRAGLFLRGRPQAPGKGEESHSLKWMRPKRHFRRPRPRYSGAGDPHGAGVSHPAGGVWEAGPERPDSRGWGKR